jgi:hypothetical protein
MGRWATEQAQVAPSPERRREGRGAPGRGPAVLVWINGPFGGGKTQTAYELQRRLRGSVVCDPERVGFGLHGMVPPALRGDFQDLAAWRSGVREVLDLVLQRHDGVVLAPMTVLEPTYLQEILGPLRDRGHLVRHYTLLAERETVLRRLRERGLGHVLQAVGRQDAQLRRETFAVSMLDRCLERLPDPFFAEHLHTDSLGVPAVAERIARSAGLDLSPADGNPLRSRLRRTWIGVKHIRLG